MTEPWLMVERVNRAICAIVVGSIAGESAGKAAIRCLLDQIREPSPAAIVAGLTASLKMRSTPGASTEDVFAAGYRAAINEIRREVLGP